MKSTRTILALLISVLALPLATVGQAKEASPEMASNDQATEDIVVVGKKSMSKLRREVYESEEDFYALYNKLNDDGEYDVRCWYETATGTRVKNHVCRAKFVTNAYSSRAGRNRSDLTRVANQEANPALAEKTAKYQAKLETLIAANPELEASLVRYNTARARFFEAREASANN